MHKIFRSAFGNNSKGRTHIAECIFNLIAWEIQLKIIEVQVFPPWVPFEYESIVQEESVLPGSTSITARTGIL